MGYLKAYLCHLCLRLPLLEFIETEDGFCSGIQISSAHVPKELNHELVVQGVMFLIMNEQCSFSWRGQSTYGEKAVNGPPCLRCECGAYGEGTFLHHHPKISVQLLLILSLTHDLRGGYSPKLAHLQ